MKDYSIEKDSNGGIVIRMSSELARDVADAIDHGLDMKAVNAIFVNALADGIHRMIGD